MKILIAPDSFKESLSAVEVAAALKKGLQRELPDAEIDMIPISDGGEGFIDAMIAGINGFKKTYPVHDALNRPKTGRIGFSSDKQTAIIEIAEACGLQQLEPELRNPSLTTTFGVGELIRFAAEEGVKKIVIGLGGSATNDGGAGMAAALGVRFKNDGDEEFLPNGGNLDLISRIDFSQMHALPEIEAACDVSNPLTGHNGASAVYGPQKGASPQMVLLLDRNLRHFADMVRKQTGVEMENIPGSGAAGGLGGGLIAFGKAKLSAGFPIIAESVKLENRIADADVVITAEGKMDKQTLNGKAPWGVALIAHKLNKPVIGVAGTLGEGYQELYRNGFNVLLSIIEKPLSLDQAMKETSSLLESTGIRIAKILTTFRQEII